MARLRAGRVTRFRAEHAVGGLGGNDALSGQPAHHRRRQPRRLSLCRLYIGDDLKAITHSGTLTASATSRPQTHRPRINDSGHQELNPIEHDS